MRNSPNFIFLVLLVAVQFTFGQQKPNKAESINEDEPLRVESNLVSVPIQVMDKNGKFVTNLKLEDFIVYDNGLQRKVEHFEAVEEPFSVILLLDTSGSTQGRLDDIKSSALAFVKQLKQNDRVLPVVFDNRVRTLSNDWTSDKASLQNTIEQAKIGYDLSQAKREIIKFRGEEFVKYYVNTLLYEAVQFAIEACRKIKGRKAIILLTDGLDTGSKSASFKRTLSQVEELDALFFTIQYDSRKILRNIDTPIRQLTADNYLEKLADKSGGQFYRAANMVKINESFAEIADELRRTYYLGFYLDSTSETSLERKLAVKVKSPKMIVRARKTYVVKRN